MGSLRSKEGLRNYLRWVKNGTVDSACAICGKHPLKSFGLWRIVANDFPYDRIAKVHHMIVPIRHCTEENLNREELEELAHIKKIYLHSEYEWIIESTNKIKSMPSHYHLHIIIADNP